MVDNDPSNLNLLNEMLSEELNKKKIIEDQRVGLQEGKNDSTRNLDELNKQRKEADDELRKEDQSLAGINHEIESLSEQISKYLSDKGRFEVKRPSVESAYHAEYKILKTTEETLAAQIESCLAYSDRVEVTRSTREIELELLKIDALLKEKEQEYGSRTKFHAELLKLRDHYSDAKRDIDEFRDIMELAASCRLLRSKKFEKFRKFITVRAQRIFAEQIKKRGYRGVLEIDHEEHLLGLKVDINNTGVENEDEDEVEDLDHDPRALSGGEKSFATVCLLLALWEAMVLKY
jgi:chromosome segregation ATPase